MKLQVEREAEIGGWLRDMEDIQGGGKEAADFWLVQVTIFLIGEEGTLF